MIGLDFETFSSVDIKRHGLDRYINSPDFCVLLASTYQPTGRNRLDFMLGEPEIETKKLRELLHGQIIIAHNASFEERVLNWLGIDIVAEDIGIIDSAVVARAVGAAGKLEAAAPQLLPGQEKIEVGAKLIQKFCVPTKENGGKPYTKAALEADPDLMKDWLQFGEYCDVDAELSYKISVKYRHLMQPGEGDNVNITELMNRNGWYVDMDLVHEMHRRYQENLANLERNFKRQHPDAADLNLNSYVQLQRWCAEKGVKTKSFDKLHVDKLLLRVEAKLSDPMFMMVAAKDPKVQKQYDNYSAVYDLLVLKQELGGSSLSKLQTIIDQVGPDNRLRGQYLHIGAGQTYRTSGRGVQLQNLPRLPEEIGDVDSLFLTDDTGERTHHWSNTQLGQNLRQVFTAEHPDGALIVGDFSSIESRGLAYGAGERWKLNAYAKKKDIYKMLASTFSSFGGVTYENVTKKQRQAGKVGELACGYGAGPQAVADFAEKMGVLMPVDEASQIVQDWREANPNIVKFWHALDEALHDVVDTNTGRAVARVSFGVDGARVILTQIPTPESLLRQHPGARSIMMRLHTASGDEYLTRIFHGCYMRGNDICYYKPSENRTGDLWRARMTQPPHAWYKLYGGKLAGILTQSFCREMFFYSLRWLMDNGLTEIPNVKLIGQFHDEIVLEWWPSNEDGALTLKEAEWLLVRAMTSTNWRGFPLDAEIKHAFRYTK